MTAVDHLREMRVKLESGREKPILCGLCGGKLEVVWGRCSKTWAVFHGRGLTFEGCGLDGRWFQREKERDAAIAHVKDFFDTL